MRFSLRWGWVGLGVALALAAVLALGASVATWRIDVEIARDKLTLSSPLPPGLRLQHIDRASISLFPAPALHLAGVTLIDGEGKTVLQAPFAEVALSPLRLLVGEFAAESAKLLDGVAHVDLDALEANAPEIAGALKPPLARLDLSGASVEFVSRRRGVAIDIDHLDGSLEWPKVSQPLRLTMSGDWRGQSLALEARLDSPPGLAAGGASATMLKLSTPMGELAFAGSWMAGPTPGFEGDLIAAAPSIAALERWIGLAPPRGFAPDVISLEGKLAGDLSKFTLAEAKIEIAKQKFEGSASLSHLEDRWSASATLAADTIDLSALLGPPPQLFGEEGGWNTRDILPAPSLHYDLDLRVSAAHAVWGWLAIDEAAASLMQMQGRATLKLLEATAFKGALAGELSIANCQTLCATQASVSLNNADVGALMANLGVKSVSGHGALKAKLSATGNSPADLVASATGDARIELQDGAVEGVNIEEALRRSQRRPVDLQRDLTIGGTAFKSAHARLDIADGHASIIEAKAEAAGAIVEVQGAIDLNGREWRARISAIQASALGTPSPDAARLILALYGPWAAPTLTALTSAD